jgi:Uri superfamily endonuclease
MGIELYKDKAMDNRLDAMPGTYALILALQEPTELRIGCLGRIRFDAPFYLYFGSAFGPGGLKARINHHLQTVRRAHWHIDYLRQVADVVGAWYTSDEARLECIWAESALADRGISRVPRFGSSDCRCESHLLAVDRRPSLCAFRRQLKEVRPDLSRNLHWASFSPDTGASESVHQAASGVATHT